MKSELEQAIVTACKKLFDADVNVELTRPDEQFGDYATNVALQLAGKLGKKNPRNIATALQAELSKTLNGKAEISIAGPGFVNVTLSIGALWESANQLPANLYASQRWVVEYSCPNAFKELHAGHLYQTIAGDVISRLVEQSGAKVFRTNFGGDVGLHVGKAMYGIITELGGEFPEKLADIPADVRSTFLSHAYVSGSKAYEADEAAKTAAVADNQRVYALHSNDDHSSPFAQIYWTCRQWSYDYFDQFYKSIQVTGFDRYYPESETTPAGLKAVRSNVVTGIFEESDGAVIFRGEKVGLHTRVFITQSGLPTYEAKDVGVILNEERDYRFDHRALITGNDQTEYMKVVFAAMAELQPELANHMTHITNGTILFGDGRKMSSRLGNVTRAVDVVKTINDLVPDADSPEHKQDVVLGAVKYAFLKNKLGGDIAFDARESVSLEGNSGPYLQYAHARARSILAKAKSEKTRIENLEPGERSLVRKISEYPEVVEKATAELLPHYICTYLYELAQTFNSFYEHNRVIGSEREGVRLQLVAHYADTLKAGLSLLGIAAPDKM